MKDSGFVAPEFVTRQYKILQWVMLSYGVTSLLILYFGFSIEKIFDIQPYVSTMNINQKLLIATIFIFFLEIGFYLIRLNIKQMPILVKNIDSIDINKCISVYTEGRSYNIIILFLFLVFTIAYAVVSNENLYNMVIVSCVLQYMIFICYYDYRLLTVFRSVHEQNEIQQ